MARIPESEQDARAFTKAERRERTGLWLKDALRGLVEDET